MKWNAFSIPRYIEIISTDVDPFPGVSGSILRNNKKSGSHYKKE